MTLRQSITQAFLILGVILFFVSASHGQTRSRTAFGLHQQFVQNRAIKGYKVPAGFRWKAQAFPGLVGARPSSGYWQNGRYYFYQQQPARIFYRRR